MGEHLFATSHRDGRVNVFRRDPATGLLTFASYVDLAVQLGHPGRHLDAFPGLARRNLLYVTGMWTHASSDRDSLGISWYEFDPKDGSARRAGTIPCDAGAILPAPGGQGLYLGAVFSKAIYAVSLDAATGRPTIGAKTVGRGIGGLCVPSPDGRQLYSLDGQAVGWVEAAPAGSLAYGGSCDLAPLAPRSGLRASTVAIPPDGKHAYVAMWTYGYNSLGLFGRDEKTGALSFMKKLDAHPSMVGINHMVFTADGKRGYYSSSPENSGACLGWFTRDPETGALEFGGVAEKSRIGPNHFAFAPESGTIYLAGNWNTKYFSIYSAK